MVRVNERWKGLHRAMTMISYRLFVVIVVMTCIATMNFRVRLMKTRLYLCDSVFYDR